MLWWWLTSGVLFLVVTIFFHFGISIFLVHESFRFFPFIGFAAACSLLTFSRWATKTSYFGWMWVGVATFFFWIWIAIAVIRMSSNLWRYFWHHFYLFGFKVEHAVFVFLPRSSIIRGLIVLWTFSWATRWAIWIINTICSNPLRMQFHRSSWAPRNRTCLRIILLFFNNLPISAIELPQNTIAFFQSLHFSNFILKQSKLL